MTNNFSIRKKEIRKLGLKTSCVLLFLHQLLRRRHCRCDGEQRYDCEMFRTVLFVGDNQRRFPGRKAHEIPMRHFQDPPSGSFDFEWLVFRDQLFNQRCVHSIQMFLIPLWAFVLRVSKPRNRTARKALAITSVSSVARRKLLQKIAPKAFPSRRRKRRREFFFGKPSLTSFPSVENSSPLRSSAATLQRF